MKQNRKNEFAPRLSSAAMLHTASHRFLPPRDPHKDLLFTASQLRFTDHMRRDWNETKPLNNILLLYVLLSPCTLGCRAREASPLIPVFLHAHRALSWCPCREEAEHETVKESGLILLQDRVKSEAYVRELRGRLDEQKVKWGLAEDIRNRLMRSQFGVCDPTSAHKVTQRWYTG